MFLLTMQPIAVWEDLQRTAIYRADEAKMEMLPDFKRAYIWVVRQMEDRIGHRPDGVTWPVWAWYKHCNRTGRLALRRQENWEYEPMVCIEVDIPDSQVLLSDFDRWHFVLNNWTCAETEAEDTYFEEMIARVSKEEGQRIKEATWPRVFDLTTPTDVSWRGPIDSIQATFWELRLEQVLSVRNCRVYKKSPFVDD